MQKIQANLASQVGIPKENSFILSNGDILAVTSDSARRAGHFYAGDVYVDGNGIGDIGNIVLINSRSHLFSATLQGLRSKSLTLEGLLERR